EDRSPDFALRQQTLAVGQYNLRVRRTFSIRAFDPRPGIGPGRFGETRNPQETCRSRLAIAQLRGEFTQAHEILLRGIERHDAIENIRGFLLAPLAREILENTFVSSDRQSPIGIFQDLAKAEFLLKGRTAVAGQLFVSEAGAGGVTGTHLTFEKFSQ